MMKIDYKDFIQLLEKESKNPTCTWRKWASWVLRLPSQYKKSIHEYITKSPNKNIEDFGIDDDFNPTDWIDNILYYPKNWFKPLKVEKIDLSSLSKMLNDIKNKEDYMVVNFNDYLLLPPITHLYHFLNYFDNFRHHFGDQLEVLTFNYGYLVLEEETSIILIIHDHYLRLFVMHGILKAKGI